MCDQICIYLHIQRNETDKNQKNSSQHASAHQSSIRMIISISNRTVNSFFCATSSTYYRARGSQNVNLCNLEVDK
jgi:hypothetical protein